MEKQIEEFANDIHEATQRATKILVEETMAFVKENHRYHSKNDFNKAHTKTLHELEAEYLREKGYRKVEQGEWREVRVVRYNGTKPYTQFNHECSNCKYLNKRSKGWNTKYCPNCGAKMKGN